MTKPRFVDRSGDPRREAVLRELIRRRLRRLAEIQAAPASLGTDRERAEELVDILFKEGRR
jgi:hypothetical protein